jgi:small subunit ribosomal protein S3e
MKGYDPEGLLGPRKRLPDSVEIKDPLPDKMVLEPTSEQREPLPPAPAPVADEPYGGAQEQPLYQPPADAYVEQPVF